MQCGNDEVLWQVRVSDCSFVLFPFVEYFLSRTADTMVDGDASDDQTNALSQQEGAEPVRTAARKITTYAGRSRRAMTEDFVAQPVFFSSRLVEEVVLYYSFPLPAFKVARQSDRESCPLLIGL